MNRVESIARGESLQVDPPLAKFTKDAVPA
jgi:hypothetical protein